MKKEIFILLILIISLFSLNIVFGEADNYVTDVKGECGDIANGWKCIDTSTCFSKGILKSTTYVCANGYSCLEGDGKVSCVQGNVIGECPKSLLVGGNSCGCYSSGACASPQSPQQPCLFDILRARPCAVGYACVDKGDFGNGLNYSGSCVESKKGICGKKPDWKCLGVDQCGTNDNAISNFCADGYECGLMDDNIGCFKSCQADKDCAQGQSCDSGKCVNKQQGKCAKDDDCDKSEMCKNNLCVQNKCVNGNDCPNPAGYNCVNSRCAKFECVDDAGCKNYGLNTKCIDNHCLQCGEDKDCPQDKHCDVNLGVCKSGCKDNTGCLKGQVCDNTKCKSPCVLDKDCLLKGQTCSNMVCEPGCFINDDCKDGKVCDKSGYCELPPPSPPPKSCMNDKDCSQGLTCQNKLCKTPLPQKCDINNKCPDPNEYCKVGVCTKAGNVVPGQKCSASSDCQNGLTCKSGLCSKCAKNEDCQTNPVNPYGNGCNIATSKCVPMCGNEFCKVDQFCNTNKCEVKQAPGGPCANDFQCKISKCDLKNKVCAQPVGVARGLSCADVKGVVCSGTCNGKPSDQAREVNCCVYDPDPNKQGTPSCLSLNQYIPTLGRSIKFDRSCVPGSEGVAQVKILDGDGKPLDNEDAKKLGVPGNTYTEQDYSCGGLQLTPKDTQAQSVPGYGIFALLTSFVLLFVFYFRKKKV